MTVSLISCDDFYKFVEQNGLENALLLDVRTQDEMTAYSLDKDAMQMPLHELDADKVKAHNPDTVFVLCKVGGRAMMAANYLEAHGVQNLAVIDGGILACKGMGMRLNGTNLKPLQEEEEKMFAAIQKSVADFKARI